MTWHACRLGDVLTLKRGHDLPDSRRQDGDVPVVSSPLKKKGFSNSYFLTMPQPGYNTAPTLRYPHKYDCIISQLDKNTVREPA